VIVNISNEDPGFELLKSTKGLINTESIKDKWVAHSKVVKIEKVLKILFNQVQGLLSGNDSDIQGRFTLIAYLLNSKKNSDLTLSLIRALSSVTESSRAAMQALSLLYDAIPEGSLKFAIFKAILAQAKNADLLNMILPHLQKIENFSKDWTDVASEEKQEFYWEISQLSINESLKAKFIKMLISETSDLPQAHFEEAISQLISYSDASEITSTLSLPCINKITGQFAELIKILQEVSVSKYLAFRQSNEEYLASKGFNADKCLDTIRVLALCDLAKHHEEFSYSEAAQQLQVSEEEIDDWVVKSVTFNLLDARIDEVEKKIKATKNTTDQDEKYWENIHHLLEGWEKNLSR